MNWITLFITSALIVGLTVVIIVMSDDVSEIASLGYGGLFILAAVSSATFLIPGPSVIGVAVGGATLNPWLVGLVMGCGSVIGELPGYGFGTLNTTEISRLPGSASVKRWMDSKAIVTIFLLAAFPNYLYVRWTQSLGQE